MVADAKLGRVCSRAVRGEDRRVAGGGVGPDGVVVDVDDDDDDDDDDGSAALEMRIVTLFLMTFLSSLLLAS